MKKVIPSVVIASVLLCACANNISEATNESSALGNIPEGIVDDGNETQETEPTELFTVEDQLSVIASKKDVWYNEDPEGMLGIKYALADINNNDRLEIIVASEEAATKYTFYYIYEVNAGATDLEMMEDTITEPESFPDIIRDNIDVYSVDGIDYYAVTDYTEDGEFKTFMYVEEGFIQHIPVASFVNGKYMTNYDEEMGQSEYESAYDDYFGVMPTATLNFVWVDGSDFDVSSNEAIVDQLSQMAG